MRKKKLKARAGRGKRLKQVAALPYRIGPSGEVELALITSRETSRFIIPKGWPMKGRNDASTAACEAREEAGLVGRRTREAIGTFDYWKRLADAFVPVRVKVYPLEVRKELSRWPEKGSRRRAWVTPEQAALLVDEPQLATLVRRAGKLATHTH